MLDMRDPADTLIMDRLGENSMPEDAETIPKQILHYQIRREIGRGGMSVVYEAQDMRTGQNTALKLLTMPPTLTPEEANTLVARFEREARTVSRLSHPNVVHLQEIGVEQKQHFLAMEYLPGQTLRERMGEGILAPREAYSILTQIAAAVDAVHKAGIIHRDVKPTNVMLLPDGTVKLLDFGIARSSDETMITHAGVVTGSPSYMAPEQIKGETGTAATDLWALGVLSYEMLTGHLPFHGQSVGEVMYQIMHQSPAATPTLPLTSQKVLRRALDRNPSERYPTASAFVEALKPPIAKQESAKSRLKARVSSPLPVSRIPAGVALMALFLLGYFGVGLARHQKGVIRQMTATAQIPNPPPVQLPALPRVLEAPELDAAPAPRSGVQTGQATHLKLETKEPSETAAAVQAVPVRHQPAIRSDALPQPHKVIVVQAVREAKPTVEQPRPVRIAQTAPPKSVRPTSPVTAAKQSVPRQSVSRQSVSRQSVPRQSVPRQSVPRQSVPKQNADRSQAAPSAASHVPIQNTEQAVPVESATPSVTLPSDRDSYDPEADARLRKSAWSQNTTTANP